MKYLNPVCFYLLLGVFALSTPPPSWAQSKPVPGSMVKLTIDRFAGKEDGKANGETLEVFSDRPHLLGGLSFVLIAPEHPLLMSLTAPVLKSEVQAYAKAAAKKSVMERTEQARKPTGSFLGSYVVHPLSGWRIPVWVSDYVSKDYPSQAWLGIPAHDQWQFDFAKANGLEILPVIQLRGQDEVPNGKRLNKAYLGDGKLAESGDLTGAPVTAGEGRRNPALNAAVKWLTENDAGKSARGLGYSKWVANQRKTVLAEMDKVAKVESPSGGREKQPAPPKEPDAKPAAPKKSEKAPEVAMVKSKPDAPKKRTPAPVTAPKPVSAPPAGLYDVVSDDGTGVQTEPAAEETEGGRLKGEISGFVQRWLDANPNASRSELNMMVDRLWLISKPRMGDRDESELRRIIADALHSSGARMDSAFSSRSTIIQGRRLYPPPGRSRYYF